MRDLLFLAYAIAANLAFLLLAGWVLAEFVDPGGFSGLLWIAGALGGIHWLNCRWVFPLA